MWVQVFAGAVDTSVEYTIQETLFRLGFDGGLKDLDSCDHSFESILIWYRVKQSLRQQKESLCTLKLWVSSVFYSNTTEVAPNNTNGFSDSEAWATLSAIFGSDNEKMMNSYAARTIMANRAIVDTTSLAAEYDQNYPISVSNQWSIFMPSHLQQLLHMGLLSFGLQPNSSLVKFVIPDCNGVLLHATSPNCLAMMDKLIQNIVNETAKNNLHDQWLLSFEDCEYSEEFHEKLLSTLNRCPQVCSVSFHDSRDTTGKILGKQLAMLPNSVNFLSFCGTITKLQIQILCTYWRKRIDVARSADNNLSVGLRGLAFIDLNLNNDDLDSLKDIVQMIEGEPSKAVPGTIPNAFSSLRYIDLSRNGLSDAKCASVLAASLRHGIEGLELAGNNICDGVLFVDSWTTFFVEHKKQSLPNSLRYLGISRNNLTHAGSVSIMSAVSIHPGSVTFLDMSGNNISREEVSALKVLIRSNQVLRVLGLSYNNLSSHDTVMQLELGMVYNSSLVLVPLVGNVMSADSLSPLKVVQSKLRDNRNVISSSTLEPPKTKQSIAGYVANDSPLPLKPDLVDKMVQVHVLFSTPLVRKPGESEAPIPLDTLDCEKDIELMESIFQDARQNVGLHFDFATMKSLVDSLIRRNCRSLHFSCHGDLGGLYFEDGRGGMHVLTENRLKMHLKKTLSSNTLQFVFVSACQSRNIGETFTNAGVPHVVCVKMESKILDTAAIVFTSSFYKSFLFGKTVPESYECALEELRSSPDIARGDFESNKFELLYGYGRSIALNTPPPISVRNRVFADCHSLPQWPSCPEHCTIGPKYKSLEVFRQFIRLPVKSEVFEGREVSMYELIRNIIDRKLVFLKGPKGIGKSALTVAVCKYMADREMLKDCICFHRGTDITSFDVFLTRLKESLKNSGSNEVSAHLKGLDSSRELEMAMAPSKSNSQLSDENVIIDCLVGKEVLLVFDEMDSFLQSGNESTAAFNNLLFNIFDRAKGIKVLVVFRDTTKKWKTEKLGNIVESSLSLQPLSLESSVRLYALLAPSLQDLPAKERFINQRLQNVDIAQAKLCAGSKDVLDETLVILGEFKDGNPGDIVDMVARESAENFHIV